MYQEDLPTASWYQAASLSERHKILAKVSATKDINFSLAQRRLAVWCQQPPFEQTDYFDQRLTIDNLTETQLLTLLGTPIETIQSGYPEPPTWLSQLLQAFGANASAPTKPPQVLEPSKLAALSASEHFVVVVEPLILQGLNRLSTGMQALSQTTSIVPFELETVKEILSTGLTKRLFYWLERTLVLELNVARLQGLLQGETPEARFCSFVTRLRQPDIALSILQEYPVLARQVIVSIDHWVNFSLEFLQHLCIDWEAIKTTFFADRDPGQLVELQGGAGDSHREGRSVLIAKFSSGLQLVYKPRSLSVDVHFQSLLTWLNQRGNHPPFRILKVLDRGDHGWVEYVIAQDCQSAAEIQRFYQRQGAYLALLHALQGTDFHSENLIAVGEHPVLVDLEALFHPQLMALAVTPDELKTADFRASEKASYSVLEVGFLPNSSFGNGKTTHLDFSALGGKPKQLTDSPMPYWANKGTDEMQIQRERLEILGDQNRPTLQGQEINLMDYIQTLMTGFSDMYRLIVRHRDDLLSTTGPILAFAEDEIRVILRHTSTYAMWLGESVHPDFLRDGLDRDRFFDRLWLQIQQRPYLKKVITDERKDLFQGDIPLFTTRPASKKLWSSAGRCIQDFFLEPTLDQVCRRIQQFTEPDLAQQLWVIHASFASKAEAVPRAKTSQNRAMSVMLPTNKATPEALLAAACAVGDRLEDLAIYGENDGENDGESDASWMGLTCLNEEQWGIVPLGLALYNDLPGITLFLAYLGKITGKDRYTALAKATLITIRRQIQRRRSEITSIGAFDGWGGVIYTLTHLSAIWHQPELLAEAEQIVERLPDLIEQDKQFDIISGAAGCLASLLCLYQHQLHQHRPSESTLSAALQCGRHLVAHAKPKEQGVGWNSFGEESEPLAGFSHGVAGVSWTLLALAALTDISDFKTTALAALDYERSLFHPPENNWLDLRRFTDKVLAKDGNHSTCMTAWCHGAPGIGLARLLSLPYLDDDNIRNGNIRNGNIRNGNIFNDNIRTEIDIALQTTQANGFGHNHSLCHGDLGNLELILQASLRLADVSVGPSWQAQINRLASNLLKSIETHGWRCGTPSELETPGLMTGLAGIGYGLLRLATPTQVPSILLLEPPKPETYP